MIPSTTCPVCFCQSFCQIRAAYGKCGVKFAFFQASAAFVLW